MRLVEPAGDPTGLAEVMLGALGLTGVLTLLAILMGVVMAAVLFWIRSRAD